MHKKRVSAKTCPEILKSLAAQLDTLSAEDLGTFGFSRFYGFGWTIHLSKIHLSVVRHGATRNYCCLDFFIKKMKREIVTQRYLQWGGPERHYPKPDIYQLMGSRCCHCPS